MNLRDYHELFRYLAKEYCLYEEDITYVENISDWCKEMGIREPDRDKPLKLISKIAPGCRILVRETVSDKVLGERINALSIRGALTNVAFDRASLLDTEQKKLAYLFLLEYARTLPELGEDDLMMDDWVFKEMDRIGFFKGKSF